MGSLKSVRIYLTDPVYCLIMDLPILDLTLRDLGLGLCTLVFGPWTFRLGLVNKLRNIRIFEQLITYQSYR